MRNQRLRFQTQQAEQNPRLRLNFLSAQPSKSAETASRVFDVVLVAADQNGWHFPVSVLKAAAKLFNGVTAFCDHNGAGDGYVGYTTQPSVRDVVGVISNAREKDGYLHGQLHVSPSAYWLSGLLDFAIELKGQGVTPPDVGMSADLSFVSDAHNVVTEIMRVWSVDVVFDPAAGGDTILRALNSTAQTVEKNSTEGDMLKFWRVLFQHDPDTGGAGGGVAPVAPPAPAPVAAPALADNQKASDDLLRMQCAQTLNAVLATSTLPEIHRSVVRERFESKIFTVAELNQALDQQKRIHADYVAKTAVGGIEAPQAIQGRAFVGGMWTDLDRMQFSVERMLGVTLSEQEESLAPRLDGIKQAYLLLSGDYSMRGQFDGSRVQFANATTSTMAGLVTSAFNKVVKAKWAELQPIYGWYKKVFIEEPFGSLNTVNWITVGGFGDLATVPEGGAYAEMNWDDNSETATWLKKGGYIGLTLEMMDRDETRKAKQIPVALATAGIRTLSTKCAAILTGNANLADGVALFHSTSSARGGDGGAATGNKSTTALSAAEWDVHIQKTFARKELNSSRRLGLRPKYRVVPIELEKTSLTIGASAGEPGTANNDVNVRAEASRETTVVCPEFTDTTDWYSVVDPKIYPCLGVGYRFGDVPEVFTAGDETVGSMFTNDEMRVKARFFFAAGVIDWRGLRWAAV